MRKLAALLVVFPMIGAAQTAQEAPPPSQPQYAPPPPQYTPAPSQYAQPYRRADRQRDSWYIGFGVGGGDARIKVPSGTHSLDEFFGDDTTPIALSFKVGATLTPKLLLGFDLTSISASAEYADPTFGDVDRSLSIVNLNAVATFFPMERGLFLRGGLGLAGISSRIDTSFGDVSDSYSGVNVLGGVGYALWLGQAFNLTVGLDYSAQSYGGDGPDSSSFWTLGVGCDWY
jgi:hypothetical protein